MIRVNLLQSYTSVGVAPMGTVAPANTAVRRRNLDFQPDILVKLVVAIIPLIGVISYDYYLAGQRQRAMVQVNAELADARQKLAILPVPLEFGQFRGVVAPQADIVARTGKMNRERRAP